MGKAQISVELVVMASVMLFLLLTMFVANENLSSSWERQKQSLQASAAADRVAAAVARASAFGNGTSVSFFNGVGPDVVNMSVFEGRSIIANTVSRVSVSVTTICNETSAPSGIPVNEEIVVRNSGGAIIIGAA